MSSRDNNQELSLGGESGVGSGVNTAPQSQTDGARPAQGPPQTQQPRRVDQTFNIEGLRERTKLFPGHGLTDFVLANDGRCVCLSRYPTFTVPLPLLRKAAAGGGGRGMRIVRTEEELGPAMRTAATEASAAFKNGDIYVEKYIENPRHIEIQVPTGEHGHCIRLRESDRSIRRRHQKHIEEVPSVMLTPDAGRARKGRLHHRGDKADERDPGRGRQRHRQNLS